MEPNECRTASKAAKRYWNNVKKEIYSHTIPCMILDAWYAGYAEGKRKQRPLKEVKLMKKG